MPSSERVSVIIPTFNRARFLADAIGSVLDQTHRDVELIVVDDGSTDDTPAVLGRVVDTRLRVVRIAHSGRPARARNVGIAHASGRFLAFLDSDDVWRTTKLERQLAALRHAPAYRWSYTLFDHIDEEGAFMAPLRGGVGRPRSGWIVESMITEEALVMVQSVLAERSLIDEVGGFDEAPDLREDLDLCFRLATVSQAVAVNEELLRVRHHPRRTTFALPEVRGWRVKALRKLARSSHDRDIRRLCRRECAREMVELARVYEASKRPGAAVRTLTRAFGYRPFPAGWLGTLARIPARPLTPKWALNAYHRLRSRSSSPPSARSRDQDATGA
jgi:glycosyltransferase involved in cell wall biosynthesis